MNPSCHIKNALVEWAAKKIQKLDRFQKRLFKYVYWFDHASKDSLQVDAYNQYTVRIYGSNSRHLGSSPAPWCAPPSDVIKLNAEASISNDGWVGLGVVARDSRGQVIFSAVRRCRAYWPPELAECKAVHMAVRLAILHGLSNVIFESDSQAVSPRLSKTAYIFQIWIPFLGMFSLCVMLSFIFYPIFCVSFVFHLLFLVDYNAFWN